MKKNYLALLILGMLAINSNLFGDKEEANKTLIQKITTNKKDLLKGSAGLLASVFFCISAIGTAFDRPNELIYQLDQIIGEPYLDLCTLISPKLGLNLELEQSINSYKCLNFLALTMLSYKLAKYGSRKLLTIFKSKNLD